MFEKANFFILDDCIKNWQYSQDVITSNVFFYLISKAEFAPLKNSGLKRGECTAALDYIASNLNITRSQARTAYKKLQACGAVSCRSTIDDRFVTVNNYAKYQDREGLRPNDTLDAFNSPSSRSYLKVQRDLFKMDRIVRSPKAFFLFRHLLTNARRMGGMGDGIDRGELLTSVCDLSNSTGLSYYDVESLLKFLAVPNENDGISAIEYSETSRGMIVRVVAYDALIYGASGLISHCNDDDTLNDTPIALYKQVTGNITTYTTHNIREAENLAEDENLKPGSLELMNQIDIEEAIAMNNQEDEFSLTPPPSAHTDKPQKTKHKRSSGAKVKNRNFHDCPPTYEECAAVYGTEKRRFELKDFWDRYCDNDWMRPKRKDEPPTLPVRSLADAMRRWDKTGKEKGDPLISNFDPLGLVRPDVDALQWVRWCEVVAERGLRFDRYVCEMFADRLAKYHDHTQKHMVEAAILRPKCDIWEPLPWMLDAESNVVVMPDAPFEPPTINQVALECQYQDYVYFNIDEFITYNELRNWSSARRFGGWRGLAKVWYLKSKDIAHKNGTFIELFKPEEFMALELERLKAESNNVVEAGSCSNLTALPKPLSK